MHLNNPPLRSDDSVRPLHWTGKGLSVLDQRCLPEQIRHDVFDSADGIEEAIRTMRVRGAPAIGIAAAFGVVLAAHDRYSSNPDNWRQDIQSDIRRLAESRPTAVNLHWALEQMQQEFDTISGNPEPVLLARALSIQEQDIEANRSMGRMGAEVLAGTRGILTHCNAGSLATAGYGTALGVIREYYRRGLERVYATETRPWNQGARLTAWELQQDRIPVTLIADSTAATLMKNKQVEWVVVGADRIAANGDVANKIGTYSLAVLARHHQIRLMVAAPTSTIDQEITEGEGICIEERDPLELLPRHYAEPKDLVDAWNPVFDITPAGLIDVIVTEKGVVNNPSREGIDRVMNSAA